MVILRYAERSNKAGCATFLQWWQISLRLTTPTALTWLSVNGMVFAVMTAAIQLPVMNATTVKIAKGIIAANAAAIVRYAIQQFVWAAVLNALIASSQYVSVAQLHALNARKPFVRTVLLKKEYVNNV